MVVGKNGHHDCVHKVFTGEASVEVELYHAKKSGGGEEGDRVGDVYDVCGQANKSIVWTTSKATFLKKLTN